MKKTLISIFFIYIKITDIIGKTKEIYKKIKKGDLMNFFDYLKNIFIILIFLQIAPILIRSIKNQYSKMLMPRSKVGLIRIRGILYNSDYYNRYLNKFFKDPSIKAIMIKMDCPGSASGTAQAIFNEILMLKREYDKPIITLVENISASGGYYIACATDAIISPPSAIIGSIGSAFQYLFQLKEFIENYKIKYKAITAGKYKTSTDPFVDMSADQETLLQQVLDSSYEQFAEDVAKHRKLSLKDKEKWAEGKIFTASQALELGLVDSLGSAYLATQIIKEKALIKEEIEWIKPPRKTGLLKWFGGQDASEEEDSSMFNAFATKLCKFLEERYLQNKLM